MHSPIIGIVKQARPLTLAEAQNEYEAEVRQTPGVTREDVELDFVSFGDVASAAVALAQKAAKQLRGLSSESRSADVTATARMIGDLLADQFGLDRDAAVIVDLMIQAERV